MKKCWKRRALSLVEVGLAVVVAVLLGAVAPGWAADADSDGVDDAVDACPDTEIPEGVPTQALLPLHYALTDNDFTFNTFQGAESSFTTAATAGCSCTQIIALSGLGPLASKFGCNQQVMQAFIAGLEAAPADGTVSLPDGVTGPPLAYQDNGDGTITDLNTGLMWEKKVAGGGTCTGALHAVDALCTWVEATGDWINAINAEGGTGYAGHSDWRVPNIKELQSIVDYGVPFPGPTVDSTFPGATAASYYWSSTTLASNPYGAWFVFFGFGSVGFGDELFSQRVRAVRGGQ